MKLRKSKSHQKLLRADEERHALSTATSPASQGEAPWGVQSIDSPCEDTAAVAQWKNCAHLSCHSWSLGWVVLGCWWTEACHLYKNVGSMRLGIFAHPVYCCFYVFLVPGTLDMQKMLWTGRRNSGSKIVLRKLTLKLVTILQSWNG